MSRCPSMSTAACDCSKGMYPSRGSYIPSLGCISTKRTSPKTIGKPSIWMRTGPHTSPETGSCVAVSISTVRTPSSVPRRSFHALGSTRNDAPVSTSASSRIVFEASLTFATVTEVTIRPIGEIPCVRLDTVTPQPEQSNGGWGQVNRRPTRNSRPNVPSHREHAAGGPVDAAARLWCPGFR